MKMKFGAIVVDGSGKIGGHVASKNRAGAYLRTKVTPINPATVYQQNARGLLGSLSTQWSGLTAAQRLSFNNAVSQFAKTDIFGDLKNPSGFNLFVKLNSNLVNSGQAQITAAPEKVEIVYEGITSTIFDVSSSLATITLAGSALDGAIVMVYATPSLSAGTSFAKNKKRFVAAVTVTASVIEFGTAYIARFGAFAAGANIQVSFRVIEATGQQGSEQSAPVLVQA